MDLMETLYFMNVAVKQAEAFIASVLSDPHNDKFAEIVSSECTGCLLHRILCIRRCAL